MDTLWHAGLSNAAWASGLALLAALVGRWGRHPALTHGLWVLVLVKLVTPPCWSVALPQFRSMATDDVADVARTDPAEIASTSGQSLEEDTAGNGTMIAEPAPQGEDESRLLDSAKFGPTVILPWTSALIFVWLSGSAAWFLLAGWRVARFRRLLRYAQPAPAAVRDQVQHLAQELGLTRLPGVWLVPGAVSPMLWAILGRPRLLVPAALWERLEEDQRATLLAHELAHLRRRDHWVRRLELVATGLYWWHPVVWWVRRAIERAEEECCDAWVVWVLPQAARAYAEALLKTVDFLSEVRCPLPPAVSGIGHVHFLRRRLAMIMRGTCVRKLSRLGLWGLIGFGALVLSLLPGLGPDQSVAAAPDDPAPRATSDKPSRPAGSIQNTFTALEGERPGLDKGKGSPRQPKQAARSRQQGEELQDARDEVELLEVQLEGKRAELKEGEARLMIAVRQRGKLQRLYDKGAVAEGEMAKAKDAVDLATIQLESKRVQVKEAEVRLNQAKRHLARMQSSSPVGGKNPSAAISARSRETAAGLAARRDQLLAVFKDYEQQYRQKQASSPAEAQEIQAFLQRLKAEISTLENRLGALGTIETKAPKDVVQLRKELEQAIKEIEQDKAKAVDRLRAQRARAEAEKAWAEAAAREARRQWELPRKHIETKKGSEKADSARVKSLEDKLDAVAKELDTLRKEIRNLDRRPESPRRDENKTPLKPPAKR